MKKGRNALSVLRTSLEDLLSGHQRANRLAQWLSSGTVGK